MSNPLQKIKVFHLLGSIKLAVPLLTTIVSVLIWATFNETSLGSELIQQTVYKSLWFGALMFLLSLNLGTSALLRYPWRGARKIGFALTHCGLVVLIAGAAAVIHGSAEGMITLRVGETPQDVLRVQGDRVEVATDLDHVDKADILLHPDGRVTPEQVGDLRLLGYSPNIKTTMTFTPGSTVPNPAVRLQFHSDRMGQTLEQWLAIAPNAYRHQSLGPAELEIIQAEDEAELAHLLTVPEAPEALSPLGGLQVTTAQGETLLPVTDLLNTPEQVGDLSLEVTQVWQDFRLDANGQPLEGSDQPRNPALQVKLVQGETQETWFVFANPDFPPIPAEQQGEPLALQALSYQFTAPPAEDLLRVIVSPSGEVFYSSRSSQTWETGAWPLGSAITPGWADFEITLLDLIPNAQPQREMIPVPATGAEDRPALQVAIGDGSPQWLAWGEPRELTTGDQSYFAAFTPRRLHLPFTIALDHFQVDRNEGTDSIAMWTSSVTLTNPETAEQVQRKVWMNHPTWFQGWKLAQASWNPGDLQLSTLQVKREPWWMTALTSLGSGLVVGGIGIMFYGSALLKRLSALSAPPIPQSERSLSPTVSPAPDSKTVLS
ncbi:MAG: cytochrome c biogenesis protein ResB [Prochlorothrix sp.]